MLMVTLLFLFGCEQVKTPLQDDKVLEIKQSIIDTYYSESEFTHTPDDVHFYYYGTFNDVIVIMRLSVLELRMIGYDVYDIYYPNTYYIEAWKDGHFYRLKEAQELGLLTEANLKTVARIHKNEFDRVYDQNYWF